MKIIRVASSIIFLALSGCAHTAYQHGYAGYGGGYTVQRYYDYDGYGPSYYSPGTSVIYERSYVQPHFEHHHHREHDEHDQGFGRYQDRHRDWQTPMRPPTHQPRHFDGGHGDWPRRPTGGIDRGDRKFVPSLRNAEPTPSWAVQKQQRQPKSEQHGKPGQRRQDLGGDRRHVDGKSGDGRHGNGDRRGRGDGHYR